MWINFFNSCYKFWIKIVIIWEISCVLFDCGIFLILLVFKICFKNFGKVCRVLELDRCFFFLGFKVDILGDWSFFNMLKKFWW